MNGKFFFKDHLYTTKTCLKDEWSLLTILVLYNIICLSIKTIFVVKKKRVLFKSVSNFFIQMNEENGRRKSGAINLGHCQKITI